jgi:hypothetical protein
MQQNGHYELHPVDHHPFEAIGDYVPIGSMVPPATFNDLGHHQYFSERDIKKPIFSHASSTCHRVGSQLPMSLTPKTEVSHLIESGLRVPSSFGLSGTSQQYFSLRTNQPPATSQQYFSLTTNQHQPSATSQTNRLHIRLTRRVTGLYRERRHLVTC